MAESSEILKKYWGYDAFRPLQEDIIESILNKKDTLALLPTGGGKSICYQVPGLLLHGVCIVVTPLIALMKDQVENLKKKGIPAVAVFSGLSKREIDITLDNCVYGNIKFLYVSPERLSTPLFLERLKKMKVSMVAVDEAHCISQWGYDFRPAYLQITNIREQLPGIPVLALTATATEEVKKDICEKLKFEKERVFQKSFERKNLSYVIFHEEDKQGKLLRILNKVPGTAIIYVRNRKKTKEIAAFLMRKGLKADYYHAGLTFEERNNKQDNWINNTTRIIVATNAFGMGIDKPDVRTVVHIDIPESPEAYYQEAGRAGRDEKKAYAVTLYSNSDLLEMEQRLEISFPEPSIIKNTYQALANFYQLASGSGENETFDFDINIFCTTYNLNPGLTYSSLHILEIEGLITLSESVFLPSRVKMQMNNEQLYEFQVKNKGLDNFIKLLLRSYEGLFEDYVKINEKVLSERSKLPLKTVLEHLLYLKKLEVVDYLPKKDTPQLTFLKPRLDAKLLKISNENLKERKERYLKKYSAIREYVLNTEKCRSNELLAYFGEHKKERCGVCDICLGRIKSEIQNEEFEIIKRKIQSLLESSNFELKEIIEKSGFSNEQKVVEVIRWLLDNEEIGYNEANQLELLSF